MLLLYWEFQFERFITLWVHCIRCLQLYLEEHSSAMYFAADIDWHLTNPGYPPRQGLLGSKTTKILGGGVCSSWGTCGTSVP